MSSNREGDHDHRQLPDGFAEAAQVAVTEASETLRGISGVDVISMSGEVSDDKITTYRTTVNIAFAIAR